MKILESPDGCIFWLGEPYWSRLMAIQPRRNCQCILDMQPRPERRHNLGVDETPRQGCFVSLTSLVRQLPRPP